mgnify:CR=1 FL=1
MKIDLKVKPIFKKEEKEDGKTITVDMKKVAMIAAGIYIGCKVHEKVLTRSFTNAMYQALTKFAFS